MNALYVCCGDSVPEERHGTASNIRSMRKPGTMGREIEKLIRGSASRRKKDCIRIRNRLPGKRG